MLAWIQRIWVALLLIAAFAIAALAWNLGWPWWAALVGAVLVLNVHALVLGIEFVWLRSVEPGPGIPRPTVRALIAAWWGEVVTGLRVFGWRQPFRADAVSDELSASASRRGVLLIHGFVCN